MFLFVSDKETAWSSSLNSKNIRWVVSLENVYSEKKHHIRMRSHPPRQENCLFEMIETNKKRAATWQNQQCGCAPSKDSDQPGHPPSLIRIFAVRSKKAWVLSYPLSAQRRLWSDWADPQADLSLRWAHSHFVGFVMRRLKDAIRVASQDVNPFLKNMSYRTKHMISRIGIWWWWWWWW